MGGSTNPRRRPSPPPGTATTRAKLHGAGSGRRHRWEPGSARSCEEPPPGGSSSFQAPDAVPAPLVTNDDRSEALLVPLPQEGAAGSTHYRLERYVRDEISYLRPLTLPRIAHPGILHDPPRCYIQLAMHRAQLATLAVQDDQAMIVDLPQAPVDPIHQRRDKQGGPRLPPRGETSDRGTAAVHLRRAHTRAGAPTRGAPAAALAQGRRAHHINPAARWIKAQAVICSCLARSASATIWAARLGSPRASRCACWAMRRAAS